MRVVVIGSGMAGLTAAAYLARDGHAVTLFEQFPTLGGVTATLRQDGFGWDLGPLLLEGFGPGEPAARALVELGVAGQVQLLRDDRALTFPDFRLRRPKDYAGPYWRREALKGLFPEDADGLDRYYRLYDRVMDLLALKRQIESADGPQALALKARVAFEYALLRPMAAWSAQRLLEHLFVRPELRAVFAGILADFVVRPSEFPALGIPAVNVETAFDRRIPLEGSSAGPHPSYHYILGGVGMLVAALAGEIRRNGGELYTGAPVRRVRVARGRVTGVEVEGAGPVTADLVVASGGAEELFYGLVGVRHLPTDLIETVEQIARMQSVFMVHLGIDFDPRPHQPEALCYHYGTYDIEGGVERCQAGVYHEGREGFVIYVPSRHSPELAPAGCHAVTVYTIAPDRLAEGSWADRREMLAARLVEHAERVIPGLDAHARTRVVLTPEDFRQRTHLARHSFGGLAPVIGRARPPHRTPIEGLWFVGAQSESAGGVSAVIDGARTVAAAIRAGGSKA